MAKISGYTELTSPDGSDILPIVDLSGTPITKKVTVDNLVGSGGDIVKEIKSAITSDTTWTDLVPAGYMLEAVVFEETAGNAGTLSLGTSDGAVDVFEDIVVAASDITVVRIDEIFSTSSAQTLDLNDDGASGTWNSCSVNVTFLMRKIIA